MKRIPLFCAVGAVAVFTTPAIALDIMNDDDTAYTLEVTHGQGSADTETLRIEAGQAMLDVCGDGCAIKLDNGEEAEFAGNESVSITDGQFVIAE